MLGCAGGVRSRDQAAGYLPNGSPALPEYEVIALRYATREAQRRDHFIGGDAHDGPMPMDYFVWAAVGRAGVYLIDTGFTFEMAKERKRTFLRCPIDSLALLGVDAGSVRDVILTHMHYGHAATSTSCRTRAATSRSASWRTPRVSTCAIPSSATAFTSRTWLAWCD
jgi:hypothetical protein